MVSGKNTVRLKGIGDWTNSVSAYMAAPEQTATTRPATPPSVVSNFADYELKATRIDKAIERIPPMPQVAHEVLELSRKDTTEVRDYVGVLEKDPIMVARLLKVVNSAFYRRRVPATSVEDIVRRLGSKAICDIVMSTTVGNSLQTQKHDAYAYTDNGLWQHSFCVASVAQKINGALNMDQPAFLMGLTHEIGKMVINFAMEGIDRSVRFSTEEEEQQVLGIDHAQLGHRVAVGWNLPSFVSEVILNHHALDDAEYVKGAAIVSLADTLVMKHNVGTADVGEEPTVDVSEQATQTLGITTDVAESFFAEITPQISSFEAQSTAWLT
ncbi:MAG: HDOD domain-containing protein [Myxococcota bacterium]